MQLPVRVSTVFDHPYSPVARYRALEIGEERMRAALATWRDKPAPDIESQSKPALVQIASDARADLTNIAAHVPARIGPVAGLAIGVTAAGIAGAAHGATGSAWLSAAMGIGACVATLYVDDPDRQAAARAVATSLTAVGLYHAVRAAAGELRA